MFLLSALAASCSSRPSSTPRELEPEPLRLVSCATDARGVRHYSFSDGSALAMDPLEPFSETPR